jgi:hypothetical protein
MEQDHLPKYVCEFIKINKKMMGISANLNGEFGDKSILRRILVLSFAP